MKYFTSSTKQKLILIINKINNNISIKWESPSAPNIPGSTFKKPDLDQNPIKFCFPLRHDMRRFVAVDP